MDIVPLVYRINSTRLGKLHIRVGKIKSTDRRIQGKAVDPMARSIDQHRRSTIYYIPRGHLILSGLQKIFQGNGGPDGSYPSVYGKNSAYRYVYVYIGRTVQRIYKYHIFVPVLLIIAVDTNKIFLFLGGNATDNFPIGQGTDKLFIGQHVQFLLVLALYVHLPGSPQNIYKTRLVYLIVYDLCRQSDRIDKFGKFSCRIGKIRFVLNNKFAQGRIFFLHDKNSFKLFQYARSRSLREPFCSRFFPFLLTGEAKPV